MLGYIKKLLYLCITIFSPLNYLIMQKRKTTEQEKRMFRYLNEVRNSGKVNMTAGGVLLEKAFRLPTDEAIRIHSLWMFNFDKTGKYEEVED